MASGAVSEDPISPPYLGSQGIHIIEFVKENQFLLSQVEGEDPGAQQSENEI